MLTIENLNFCLSNFQVKDNLLIKKDWIPKPTLSKKLNPFIKYGI